MRRARRQEKAAAQREGPWTGAVQNESQLQDDTSKLAVGSAEGQAKSRFRASLLCRTKASCRRTRASWQLAVQKGRRSQGWSQFLIGSESDVWQSGLPAARPIRPSLPWCFSPARAASTTFYHAGTKAVRLATRNAFGAHKLFIEILSEPLVGARGLLSYGHRLTSCL